MLSAAPPNMSSFQDVADALLHVQVSVCISGLCAGCNGGIQQQPVNIVRCIGGISRPPDASAAADYVCMQLWKEQGLGCICKCQDAAEGRDNSLVSPAGVQAPRGMPLFQRHTRAPRTVYPRPKQYFFMTFDTTRLGAVPFWDPWIMCLILCIMSSAERQGG